DGDRPAFHDVPRGLESVHAIHMDVHQHHIGGRLLHEGHCEVASTKGPDHMQCRILLDEVHQEHPGQLALVHHQHPYRLRAHDASRVPTSRHTASSKSRWSKLALAI